MAEPKSIVYVDEDVGVDEASVPGTEAQPFKTVVFAYIQTQGAADYLTRKSKTGTVLEGADKSALLEWKPAAKSALKKAVNALQQHQKKAAREKELAVQRQKEDKARHAAFEEAKKIVIEEDSSLPKAKRIRLDDQEDIKLRSASAAGDSVEERGTRIRVFGRVHNLRKQKDVIFIELKDGYGKMQCLLTGKLAKTYDALTLTRETSIEIYGELYEVPPGAKASLNRELHADYFRIEPIWKAAGGEDAITTRVAPGADPTTLLNLRHLTLRGDKASAVMLVRDYIEHAFLSVYRSLRMRKVSPPALVQTQVEGGATLFKFDYYGETSFLTQSSQLYLETCLPSMGDVYCIEKSFRAEKSLTRRHLSEYTHIEAELDFISFDDLLDHIELVISRVIEMILGDPETASHIKRLNPSFEVPKLPFLRMRYSDAIDWLNEHGIENEDGKTHAFGDDIAEAAERRMTDILNQTVLLTHFPVEIKAFYMQKDKNDPRVTESVDVLVPGVGEVVGGSMRMDDYNELMAAYKREGIDPEPYYWYIDQRKYGSSPHGGYGLGLERFLAWICGLHTVREACLYPRYMNRCTP
ncbi:asparaginyl-tRNA synthetase [Trichodelitschia bisporula]|uniref:asparagine--tRNA ligase n=1 Tax=Trichodelitschia bisporula TaxID=703511 RepID=A0A6G1IAQ0_9PEZI|nr:asparaginyl-tRNA synthetase [Trichodelitschia bisporula]